MDRVLLEGKEYVKVSTAAKETGYTADYIGQLCRAGKIDAKLVGRSWYVHESEIRDHRKGKSRSNAEKTLTSAREVLKTETEQTPLSRVSYSLPEYKKRLLAENINYHADSESLIPEPVRKEEIPAPEEVVSAFAVNSLEEEKVKPEEEVEREEQEEVMIPIHTPKLEEETIEEIEEEVLPATVLVELQKPQERVSVVSTKQSTYKPVIYVSKVPMLISVVLGVIVASGILFLQSHISFKQGAGQVEFSNSYSLSSAASVINSIAQLK